MLALRKPLSTVLFFLMVTHLISLAKKTSSIFTILTMYHYPLHIEKLKTFFSQQLYKFIAMLSQNGDTTNTRDAQF